MKDIGEADVILGIKIKRENKGIVITQSHYIEKILKKFNHEDCSPSIGCLMYAMASTRPDIAYVVSRLSRFTSNPSRQHWQAITRVFKYLKDVDGCPAWGRLPFHGLPKVGTCVFIFPRCKTKRITYVNMKFCRFKKLGLGFLYVSLMDWDHMAYNVVKVKECGKNSGKFVE
ncbi:hypothetical protein Tco_1504408 [Tanacetum coccineum]